jgi:methionine aminopeptidase
LIFLKTKNEIEVMREASRIVAELLDYLGRNIGIGISTADLDRLAHEFIVKKKPSRLSRDTRGTLQPSVHRSMKRLFMGSRVQGSLRLAML